MIYNLSLIVLIAVTVWAMFSGRVQDKLGIIVALVFVAFGAMAMLAQSTVGWHVAERANQAFVFGASIFAARCFYIKSGLKRRLRAKACKCKVVD